MALASLLCAATPGEPAKKRILIAAAVARAQKATLDVESAAVAKAAAHAAAYALDLAPIGIQDAPPDLAEALSTCGADPRCIGARLESAGLGLGLFLVANFSTSPHIVTARVIDAAGSVLQSSVWEFDPAKADIAAEIASDTMDLLDKSGHPIGGRIIVDPKPLDASVSLTARLTGAAFQAAPPNVFLVPAGEYRVDANKDGWVHAAAETAVKRGQDATISVALASEPTILESPWLWIGAGAAVAGAVTAFLVIHHNAEPLTLCQATSRSMCPQ
jgi:hypothetical protein